jgi:hypothetical protein
VEGVGRKGACEYVDRLCAVLLSKMFEACQCFVLWQLQMSLLLCMRCIS